MANENCLGTLKDKDYKKAGGYYYFWA